MAYCSNCGIQLNEDAKFCPNCGNKVENGTTSPQQEDVQYQDYEDEELKTWQKIISVLCWPAGVILIIYMLVKERSDDAIETFKYTIAGIILAIALNYSLGGCSYNLLNGIKSNTAVNDTVDTAYVTPYEIYTEETSDETSEELNENHQAEYNAILQECQQEISSIQSEIESLCNQFVVMGSGDLDIMTYGQMKITMSNGVDDLVSKANRVYDNCINKLNGIGEVNAAQMMKEEKRNFYNAAMKIKYQAQERAESTY